MPSRRPARKAAPGTHEVQAAVEGVSLPGKLTLRGADFTMADTIGMMPLLRFAHASRQGLDTADMEGMAALYDMIRDCIAADEWPRFEQHATDTKADAEDLLKVVQQAIEVIAARPTRPPGDSSTGRRATSANSKGSSPKTGMEPVDGMMPVDLLLDR